MKKAIIILMVFTTIFTTNCKKSSVAPEYYITMDINGSPYNYSDHLYVHCQYEAPVSNQKIALILSGFGGVADTKDTSWVKMQFVQPVQVTWGQNYDVCRQKKVDFLLTSVSDV